MLLRSRNKCFLESCRRKLWISSRQLITLGFQFKQQNKSCCRQLDKLKGQLINRNPLQLKNQNLLWLMTVPKTKASVRQFRYNLTIVKPLRSGITIVVELNSQLHLSIRCSTPCSTIRKSFQCITVECLRECHLVGVCHQITIPIRHLR